jgi:uncharacterized membrane-anchored protein
MNFAPQSLDRWVRLPTRAVPLLVLGATLSFAQHPPPAAPSGWREGPERIALGHALTLELPGGFGFLPREPAVALMERMGNLGNDDLLGLVAARESSWLVVISYQEEGYVKDDDEEKLDADELLTSLRDGTEEANQLRAEKGFKPVHVLGWSEPPRYDRTLHNLVWGVRGQREEVTVINFNTRILGRHGYASLNLIDAAEQIDAAKPAARQLLEATHFDSGARYQDFQVGKDKVAEYGLAALVAGGGGAAALKVAKLGLLAKFGAKLLALLVAAKKLVIVGAATLFALLRRLFKRRETESPPPTGS